MTPQKDPVLIITGPPGSGKTTVADAVAAQHGRAVHVESDCFFRFITSGFVEPWKPGAESQNAVVMGVVVEAAATYANADYFTIIDGIITSNHFLQTIHDRLQVHGLAVAYVVLGASLDTCLDRAIGRTSHPLGNSEAVKSLWHQFEQQSPPEGHAIETDDLDPRQLADQIVAGLRRLDQLVAACLQRFGRGASPSGSACDDRRATQPPGTDDLQSPSVWAGVAITARTQASPPHGATIEYQLAAGVESSHANWLEG